MWLSVDPLAEKYPGRSPYEYTFSNPVKYIDPTGMEGEDSQDPPEKNKMILLMFEGGLKGDKSTLNESPKGGGRKYIEDYCIGAKNKAKNKGIEIKGGVVSSSFLDESKVIVGMDYISKNYNEGDTVVLYGFSNGGDGVVKTAAGLKDKGIKVDLMLIADSSDANFNLTVETTVTNVTETINYYNPDGGEGPSTVFGAELKSGDGGRVRNLRVSSKWSHGVIRGEAWGRSNKKVFELMDGIKLKNSKK